MEFYNKHALYPSYIINQKEIIVGNENTVVSYNKQCGDKNLFINNKITGNEAHIDSNYNEQLSKPHVYEDYQHFPWANLKYDKAYYEK